MKGVAINLVRFATVLYYVAFSTGYVQQHRQPDHRHSPDDKIRQRESAEAATTAPAVSRRTFAVGSTAAVSSLLIGSDPVAYSARADPYNALIPAGSRILQQSATVLRAEEWAPPKLATELAKQRIGTSTDDKAPNRSIGPLQQALSPFASKELYYPSFFAGDWNVTATLQQKIFPFGPDFVPSRSLVEGSPRNRAEKVGDSTRYLARYLASENGVIADRGYNLVSLSRSYQQLAPVILDSIQWDPQSNPTRLSYQRESVTADMRPVGPIKAEVYLNARATEENAASVFACAERSRTVTVGTGSVTADDCEIVAEFARVDDRTLRGISRVAVYLTPNPNSREGILWQQVSGRAVAFYDYELLMERVAAE